MTPNQLLPIFFQNFQKSKAHFWRPKTNFSKKCHRWKSLKIWFYNEKIMSKKNLWWSMSMTPNQLLPIFFKISRKVNLIFDHLELILSKNVIDENRFKIWFYNKKIMSKKNLWWSMSMTPNQLLPIFFSKFPEK